MNMWTDGAPTCLNNGELSSTGKRGPALPGLVHRGPLICGCIPLDVDFWVGPAGPGPDRPPHAHCQVCQLRNSTRSRCLEHPFPHWPSARVNLGCFRHQQPPPTWGGLHLPVGNKGTGCEVLFTQQRVFLLRKVLRHSLHPPPPPPMWANAGSPGLSTWKEWCQCRDRRRCLGSALVLIIISGPLFT